MAVSHGFIDHILNQFGSLYLPYLETLLEQRHVILLVLGRHLLIAVLLDPLLPLLQPILFVLAFLVLLEVAGVPTVAILPLVELPIDGQVRLLEILLPVALEGSGRVHQIIGCIKLGQILAIGIFVDTVLLIPLCLFGIVHFIR